MNTEPIRILQVIPDMRAGGAENFIMNLYRNIDREKVQFDFAVHYQEKRFFDNEIEKLGGKIYRFTLRNDNRLIKYIRELNKFYKGHPEYKIVHCHWNGMGFIHLLVAKHNNVNVRIGHSHNSSAGKGVKGFVKKLMIMPYKYFTTENFSCSDEAGRFLFGKREYKFIPNAIDTKKFKFDITKRNNIRNSLGLKENDILLGHVGRFNIQKNHKRLIEIFNEVCKNNSIYHLIMIGEGELLDATKQLVKDYKLEDYVIFAGVQEDMVSYYSAMDCFLMPSLYEGLPVTAVESQACGLLTLLSSNVTRQVMITSNVYYLNNDDIKSWRDNILSRRISDIDRIEANRIVSESEFNITQLSDSLEKMYVKLYEKA